MPPCLFTLLDLREAGGGATNTNLVRTAQRCQRHSRVSSPSSALSLSFVSLVMVTLKVDGMMCSHCTGHVHEVLASVDGVETVTVDLDSGTATVDGSVDAGVLVAAVIAARPDSNCTPVVSSTVTLSVEGMMCGHWCVHFSHCISPGVFLWPFSPSSTLPLHPRLSRLNAFLDVHARSQHRDRR